MEKGKGFRGVSPPPLDLESPFACELLLTIYIIYIDGVPDHGEERPYKKLFRFPLISIIKYVISPPKTHIFTHIFIILK